MTTHHGERLARGGSISNECRSCGYFSADWGMWPRWDGVLRNAGQAYGWSQVKASLNKLEASESLMLLHRNYQEAEASFLFFETAWSSLVGRSTSCECIICLDELIPHHPQHQGVILRCG